MLPGPLATHLLRQMGARVIRVEHPKRSDLARVQPPFVAGQSTLFASLNTGKETEVIDYTSEEGLARIQALVAEADVVVEQFRPGVMAKWGLDYDKLRTYKPDLVYASLTGYGQKGEWAMQPGHDINYLAMAGVLDLNRDAAGRPVVPGVQVADIGGGSYMCAMGIVSALFHRAQTGEGSYLDISMLDGLLPLMTIPFSQQQGGMDVHTANFLSGALVNYNVYPTADKRWVALGALEIKFWNNFCRLVERPDWERSNPMELSIHVFPQEELTDLFRQRTQAEWIALTRGHDVCLSPVRTTEEVLNDPTFLRKQSLQQIALNETEQLTIPGLPYSMT